MVLILKDENTVKFKELTSRQQEEILLGKENIFPNYNLTHLQNSYDNAPIHIKTQADKLKIEAKALEEQYSILGSLDLLELSIHKYIDSQRIAFTNYEQDIYIANLLADLAQDLYKEFNYPATLTNLQLSAEYHIKGMDYEKAKERYLDVANFHKDLPTLYSLDDYIKELEQGLVVDTLIGRLALGTAYSVKKNTAKMYEHYSMAYYLSQGPIDHQALVVPQHGFGISANKIGTDNIKDCITLIIWDPTKRKAALAHLDLSNFSDPENIDMIMDNFDTNTALRAYIIGATIQHNKNPSLDNIQKLVEQFLMKYDNVTVDYKDIYLNSTQDNTKYIPTAITFNPQNGMLTNAVPWQDDGYKFLRILADTHNPKLIKWFSYSEKNHHIQLPKFDITDIKFYIEYFCNKLNNYETLWDANKYNFPLINAVEYFKENNPILTRDTLIEIYKTKIPSHWPEWIKFSINISITNKIDEYISENSNMSYIKENLELLLENSSANFNMDTFEKNLEYYENDAIIEITKQVLKIQDKSLIRELKMLSIKDFIDQHHISFLHQLEIYQKLSKIPIMIIDGKNLSFINYFLNSLGSVLGDPDWQSHISVKDLIGIYINSSNKLVQGYVPLEISNHILLSLTQYFNNTCDEHILDYLSDITQIYDYIAKFSINNNLTKNFISSTLDKVLTENVTQISTNSFGDVIKLFKSLSALTTTIESPIKSFLEKLSMAIADNNENIEWIDSLTGLEEELYKKIVGSTIEHDEVSI